MEERSCSTCVHEKGKNCKILKEKISYNCFAWADEMETASREEAIEKYSGSFGKEIPETRLSNEIKKIKANKRKLNNELRGGKTIREILEEKFNWLYQQGLSDSEIAKKISIDVRYVNEYRKNKKLPLWKKKNRPTAMETVSSPNSGLY